MFLVTLVAAALQQQLVPPAPATLPPLPPQVSDTSPFRRLGLPAANLIRSGSGMPGPSYWQQRADYTIRAALDTGTHRITGRVTIRYTNHSPDTLRYVWLQLDQNIYRQDSRGTAMNPPDTRFAGAGFVGGYTVDSVRATAPGRAGAPPKRTALNLVVNGTMGRLDLDRPLAPGGNAQLDIAYSFTVPEHGSDRMGRAHYAEGWLYEMAQWYPRMAVYDDVRGWNTDQYLGQGEFYLEYGDFDFELTVPRSYVVVATGTLLNPLEVLTATERTRLSQALKADSTIPVIAKTEAGQSTTRPAGSSSMLTWHFSAKNVRDVAWAAAPNFIWDATGWDGVLIQSAYAPESDADWANSTAYARHTIKHYSEKWFRYPYPVATNVAGPVAGMEYPMIVFCGDRTGGRALFSVTTHELGHQWFPMIVGSNERMYPWMDEGFNTFINIYSSETFYHDSILGRGDAQQWAQFAIRGLDEPPMMAADRIYPNLLGQVAYTKPATGLHLLRYHILDDTTRFDAAFREYIRRWAFKHPTPADFFRSMEDNLGEDLSWFWRGWFYSTDVVDLAVDSVSMYRDTAGAAYTGVLLSRRGGLPMPVEMRLGFADGSSERVRLPVEVWMQRNKYLYLRQYPSPLVRIEIDPDFSFPDVRRDNNLWTKR